MEGGKFGGRGICKMFGQKSVLSGADLELPIGGVAGIFGLNGAGRISCSRFPNRGGTFRKDSPFGNFAGAGI